MTSHIHMIIGTEKGDLSDIVNHLIELDTHFKTIQRLKYILQNPVVMGFVEKAEEWNSSCGDYYGNRKGVIDLVFV